MSQFISFTFLNTCRDAGAPDCGCNFSPSINYQDLPSYNTYISGTTGRSIDIDINACSQEISPSDFDDKSNFILYYRPQNNNWPLLIIDNIPYDTRNVGPGTKIKIFETNSPATLRSMVCSRIRFASILNNSLLESDINNALVSDWPFNDLYWYNCTSPDSGGGATPNPATDVAVDLIPC